MQAQTPIKTKPSRTVRITDSQNISVSKTGTSHSPGDIASNTNNTTLQRRSWSTLTCERVRHILISHHFRTAVRGRHKCFHVPYGLAVSEARLALADFYNVTIRIANVAACLAVLFLWLCDKLGSSISP